MLTAWLLKQIKRIFLFKVIFLLKCFFLKCSNKFSFFFKVLQQKPIRAFQHGMEWVEQCWRMERLRRGDGVELRFRSTQEVEKALRHNLSK